MIRATGMAKRGAGQVEAVSIYAEFAEASHQRRSARGLSDGSMKTCSGAPGTGLQQCALAGIDRNRALHMDAILCIERRLAALAALRLDHRVSELDLTQLEYGGTGCGLQRQARRKAESKTASVRPA